MPKNNAKANNTKEDSHPVVAYCHPSTARTREAIEKFARGYRHFRREAHGR
jgi:hypothetical protein